MEILCRKIEQEKLEEWYNSKKSEFIVVYGRRRVGKSFLINEYFKNRFFFSHTAISTTDTSKQILLFSKALNLNKNITNYFDLFLEFKELIFNDISNKKKVIFLDEISWFDTPKSNFVSALEYFWNGFLSKRDDILLIISGSSTSWINKKIFHNKGGLYNRKTGEIYLKPFNLSEIEIFLKYKNINYHRTDILNISIVLGGIPYYLDMLKYQYSMAQNIDYLFFSENAPLSNEYTEIISSMFKNYKVHLKIINELVKHPEGLTREDLIKYTKSNDNGLFSEKLNDLVLSGFIREYDSAPNKKLNNFYKVMDNFIIFYKTFVEGKTNNFSSGYYYSLLTDGKFYNFRGHAYERVCFEHIDKIKNKLGISGIYSYVTSFRKNKQQIDLIIDRNDNIINLFEIKYSDSEYIVTKDYYEHIIERKNSFIENTKTKKGINLGFITVNGLKKNEYYFVFQNIIELEDLF